VCGVGAIVDAVGKFWETCGSQPYGIFGVRLGWGRFTRGLSRAINLIVASKNIGKATRKSTQMMLGIAFCQAFSNVIKYD
jgi:hypothetical protein